MAIEPTTEQLEALLSGDDGGPVVMLNLLRFREEASEPAEGMSGREAYQRYGAEALPHLSDAKAEIVWMGNATGTVIGPADEAWDQVILVRYPSVKAFLEMVSKPAYQQIARFRTAALTDSRLVAMRESGRP